MEQVTIGMIGAGFIGKEHARSVRLMKPFFGKQVKLVGVADKDEKEAARLAKEFEFEYHTSEVSRVLNDDKINTIFICVPTAAHIDILEAAAKQGKAVFCEKPLAVDYVTAKKMAAIVEKYRIPCQVGFVLRFTPVYHVLRRILQERAQESKLMTVLLRDDQLIPIKGNVHFTPWRSDVAQAGAGVLLEHGIHDVDIFEWFFGPIKNVRAERRNFAGFKGIEDYIQCDLTFESGMKGTMLHIWHDIASRHVIRHFEIFYQQAFIQLEGYGTEGITIRDSRASHHLSHEDIHTMCNEMKFYPELSNRIDVVPFGDYYAIQAYAFLKSLLEGTLPSPSIEDGVRAHKVVAAAYYSADHDGALVDITSFV